MKARIALAALIESGLAFAPAAYAEDAMSKPMAKTDKMEKMDKKKHAKSHDKMKKSGDMMEHKDSMPKGEMKN